MISEKNKAADFRSAALSIMRLTNRLRSGKLQKHGGSRSWIHTYQHKI